MKCVEELLLLPTVELSLIIVGGREVQTPNNAVSFNHILWRVHAKSRYVEGLPCNQTVDISRAFASTPRLRCRTVIKDNKGEYFEPDDIAMVTRYQLDFILQFSFGSIGKSFLQAARYGVWAFYYGDETKDWGGPPGFWEVYQGDSVTGGVLRRVTDPWSVGVVLQKGFIATKGCSHVETLNSVMWATTYMPARVCRDISDDRAQYLTGPSNPTTMPFFRLPGNGQMVKYLYKITRDWLTQQFESLFFLEDWNVGVVHEPLHAFLTPGFKPQVEWLPYRRKDSFLADPFLLVSGSNLRLFAEEFDWNTDRGYIVVADLNDKVRFPLPVTKALDEGIHMSYPYVFQHESQIYCTPEASQNRGVFLYRVGRDANTFSAAATLIRDFAAVDPTLIEYGGRWWLFCTNANDEVLSKLFLWHAPELTGPWRPHRANPVKMDVRSSRPAGRPFIFQNQLYRPAQNCSRTYGGAITINRVTLLTTEGYAEEPAAHIGPIRGSRYRRGIHTADFQGPLTVIDGKRLVFAPKFFLRRLMGKLRKLSRRTSTDG